MRLSELGISGKLWHLIIDSYTGMTSKIVYDGQESKPFNILQSTRQGSMWGGFFYLIIIDMLIKEIRELDCGVYMGEVFTGIHAQADDLALISASKNGLQKMMDTCFIFACKWRYNIHPLKSKVLVWGESKRFKNTCQEKRKWIMGNNDVSEVESHIHGGVLLSTAPSNTERTKLACRKGRSIMLSICNDQVLGSEKLNPLTLLKLYKTITLPSALFGCEMWSNLTSIEKSMLERLQRFCCKVIQEMPRRTRSHMCCTMLGLQTLEGYIDSVKLKFWRRLAILPSDTISKKIFLRRLFQADMYANSSLRSTGFCSELKNIFSKYNLQDVLENLRLEHCLPDKIPWKHRVRLSILSQNVISYNNDTTHDPDYSIFRQIHPDTSKMCDARHQM